MTSAPAYFAYSLGDDLAVLELSRKLEFGAHVQPVCLPDSSAPFGPASECYSAGWGLTATGMGESAPRPLAPSNAIHLQTSTHQSDERISQGSDSVSDQSGIIYTWI